MRRTFYIKELGCAKNRTDGQSIRTAFFRHGYREAKSFKSAGVIVVNTCGFISDARQQSIDTFFEMYSQKRPDARIIIAGCLAQISYDTIFKELKEADAVVGNKNLQAFDALIDDMDSLSRDDVRSRRYGMSVDLMQNVTSCKFSAQPEDVAAPTADSSVSVYLKIAEGCDRSCAFCSIPLIRGRFHSFDEDMLISKVRELASKGAYEINLIAQDLLSYGKDKGVNNGFLSLMKRVCAIPGDFKVRMLYMHPDGFNSDVIEFVRDHADRVIPYFDIAFQHGSAKILLAMGRRRSPLDYARMVELIRSKLPDSAIRSTFLVGFPYETRSTIKELESFIRDIDLEYCGFFRYSREEGTRAALLTPSRLSARVIDEEIERLKGICDSISFQRLSRFIGKTYRMISEERLSDGTVIGRLPFQAPDADGICEVRETGLSVGKAFDVKVLECVDDYDFITQEAKE